jgi:hypothetical protein
MLISSWLMEERFAQEKVDGACGQWNLSIAIQSSDKK